MTLKLPVAMKVEMPPKFRDIVASITLAKAGVWQTTNVACLATMELYPRLLPLAEYSHEIGSSAESNRVKPCPVMFTVVGHPMAVPLGAVSAMLTTKSLIAECMLNSVGAIPRVLGLFA